MVGKIVVIGIISIGATSVFVASKLQTSILARADALQKIESAETLREVVIIKGFVFYPFEAKAKVNQEIIWINKDPVPHTIVSVGAFETKEVKPGNSSKMVISERGLYEYHSKEYPYIRGTLVVE